MKKTQVIRVGLLVCVFWCGAQSSGRQERVNWVHMEGAELVEHPANDGDSFHVRRNRTRYLLRVYFVDTPESDDRFPERLREQAEYFGVTVPQVVEGAKEADEFTREVLGEGVFEFHTKYRDARGASRRQRIFAMVRVRGRWLCELLVENGYARIHGLGDDLPDGREQQDHWDRLRELEAEAKREGRGIWGMQTLPQRLVREGGEMRLSRQAPIFALEEPHELMGHLPEGHEVRVGEMARPGFRRVEFVSPGGNEFRGLIQEISLE